MITRAIVYTFLISTLFWNFFPRHTSINPDFLSDAKIFSQLSKIPLVDKNLIIDYGWADLFVQQAIAYCVVEKIPFTGIVVQRKIIISKEWYDKANNLDRLLLLMHELGHCVLDLEHDDRLRKDGCPVSNMHSLTTSDYCNFKYLKEYIEEYKR